MHSVLLCTALAVAVALSAVLSVVTRLSVAEELPSPNAQRIARMLEAPHHERNLLVRFKQGVTTETRQAANTAAGATVKKAYRHVSGLYLVDVATEELTDALASYLDNAHVM